MPQTAPAESPTKYDRIRNERVKNTDKRSDGQRDYDRILYTSAFMRLGGVSQVAHVDDGAIVHNRLTHALKVSTLGRGLSIRLQHLFPDVLAKIGGIDPDIVAAAALAHDLGHPPFGHVAERVLQEVVEARGMLDSFEGNAQSFRVVTKLSIRKVGLRGLNLTRGTLNALLKYPLLRVGSGKPPKKWGAYSTEEPEFSFARRIETSAGIGARRCIEAEIMDFADDIAYSTHDLEDYYRAGLLPINRLLTDPEERRQFVSSSLSPDASDQELANAQRILERNLEAAPQELREPYRGRQAQRGAIRTYCSSLIDRFFDGIQPCAPNGDAPLVQIAPDIQLEIQLLKHLMWRYVISHQGLAAQEHGQKEIIRTLFKIYSEALMGDDKKYSPALIPERYSEYCAQVAAHNTPVDTVRMQYARIAVDIIAEMTEHQAVQTYRQLTGYTTQSVLDSAHR